jgi:hypothetical protein
MQKQVHVLVEATHIRQSSVEHYLISEAKTASEVPQVSL